MLSLIFILLVLFISLAVFLWVGTSWLQGLIYNEPAADLHWRAPATAGVVTAFVAAWCLLDYRLYDPTELQLPLHTLFRFSASRSYPVDEFVAEKKLEHATSTTIQEGDSEHNEVQSIAYWVPAPPTTGPAGGTFILGFDVDTTASLPFAATPAQVRTALEALSAIGAGNVAVTGAPGDYTLTFQGTLANTDVPQTTIDATRLVAKIEEVRYRRRAPGEREFVDEQEQPWRRADTSGIVTAIVIEENQKKVRFVPQVTRESMLQSTGFQEESGARVMDPLGEVRVFRPGMWLANIFLNLLHLGVWFACLWLLLRYQWHHALGLAVGLWLVMTLLPVPMVFDRMRDVARARAVTSRAEWTPHGALPVGVEHEITSMPGCA